MYARKGGHSTKCASELGQRRSVIAADTEREREWRLLRRPMAREAEAHNLSNVDAKPLTLPCSVIAHLTKPPL